MPVIDYLLSKLCGYPTASPKDFDAPLNAKQPLFIIGDIHGRSDLLELLLNKVNRISLEYHAESPRLIFVGDYVDRGENSKHVLHSIRALTEDFPETVTALMGNHERMMLDFLENPEEHGGRWLRSGGLQTLASFGIGEVGIGADALRLRKVRDQFQKALPEGMQTWLAGLPLQTQSGNIHVVHAAADPMQPIQAQPDAVLLWGQRDFFEINRSDGNWVVHGHTIVDRPNAEFGRISVDTGACFTGQLTAALIRCGEVSFITT